MTKKEPSQVYSGPTPNLGKPTRDAKLFTYAENKLLDQMTIEIMQAWKNDLLIIRKHHREILASEKATVALSNLISTEFPKLEKFLADNDFIESFKDVEKSLEQLDFRQSEMNKSIFELQEKLNFNYVKKLMESIKVMQETIEKINKRRWWHVFFKPKP